jgi:hypothetical protein
LGEAARQGQGLEHPGAQRAAYYVLLREKAFDLERFMTTMH